MPKVDIFFKDIRADKLWAQAKISQREGLRKGGR
jgi:hypothetical protein